MKPRIGFLLSVLFASMILLILFMSPASANEKQLSASRYFKYYNLGVAAANEDYEDGQLWKHYQHPMKETPRQQAFREGYLDRGAYLAMPVVNKIKWNIRDNWLGGE